MTAVQQYWIVENDVNLVSSITPVPVTDEDGIKGHPTLGDIQFDNTPLDGWVGAMALTGITIITLSVPEYINLYDSADKWKGGVGIGTITLSTSGLQQYDNLYDSVDKWKGGVAVGTITVTTVVILYDNLYDTTDKWKGAPAINTITVT